MPGLGAPARSYLLTLLAGVGQVSARTALRLGPLSSRLCFFPSGLASSPSSLTLAEKTPRFLLQILEVSREGYSRILRGGVLGGFPSCLLLSKPCPSHTNPLLNSTFQFALVSLRL